MYTKQELITILGQPAEQGHFTGKGIQEVTVLMPWGDMPQVTEGNDEFLKWSCIVDEVAIDPRERMCFAVRPTWGPKSNQGWFVIQACRNHRNKVNVTSFQELIPVLEPSREGRDSPTLLIVNSESYLQQAGEEWAQIKQLLDEDWRITLVHGDHRFPNFTFVVLENERIRRGLS